MDNSKRGQTARITTATLFLVASVIAKDSSPGSVDAILNTKYSRHNDSEFIMSWFRTRRQRVNTLSEMDTRIRNILEHGFSMNMIADNGTKFIVEEIIGSNELSEDTKTKIMGAEPEIFHFMLTYALYIYAFEKHKDDTVPGFFKPETIRSINELRTQYRGATNLSELDDLVKNLENFNSANTPQSENMRTLYRKLRGAAYMEMQDSVFLNTCYRDAVQSDQY